jgi:hypothetical protein
MLTAVDSLEIYKRLKGARVNDKAAREIATIFADMVENELATKRDLKELEIKFELKMEQVKNQMVIWYIGSFVAALAYLTALIRWAK